MEKYDIDSYGFRAKRYETIIVFRDENAFKEIIAANPNMIAVMGADDYTKKNFPGVFIAGIYPNSQQDKEEECSFPTQKLYE